ncbi:MAG: hypothetical protein M0036_16910 [Desulfobacteraceae bacterium]|nr:hypothetical protein [Desulfobacteraceae bacterium]
MNTEMNWPRLSWSIGLSGLIDCVVMALFVAMSAGVTWLIWQ